MPTFLLVYDNQLSFPIYDVFNVRRSGLWSLQCALRCFKSPTPQSFVSQFVRANNKESIKAPHHWSFVRWIHRQPVISHHKGLTMRRACIFHDIIINKLFFKLILVIHNVIITSWLRHNIVDTLFCRNDKILRYVISRIHTLHINVDLCFQKMYCFLWSMG